MTDSIIGPMRPALGSRLNTLSPPESRSSLSVWLLWLGVAAYAATFLVLYPRVPAIADENAYLTQALLMRTGRITYDHSTIPAPQMSVNMAGRTASKYPPGTGLFLLPFTLPGWRWVFLSGLALAVLGTWLFRLVLRRLEPSADPAWSLLYLLYPSVVLYSRTIMSDLLAATVLLGAFCLLLRSGRATVGAGLCLGLACLVRYSNAVLVPAFLVLIVLHAGHRFRRVVLFCLGLVPFLFAVLAYNTWCYGGPFEFPWYLTGRLDSIFLLGNLTFYLPVLLAIYPLMLPAPLAAGRHRLKLSLPAYGMLLPCLFFSYVPSLSAGITGVAIGLRYLLPATPFLVLAYALVLHRLEVSVRGARTFKYVLLAVLFALSVAVQLLHGLHLAKQDRYRRLLLDSVPDGALLACNARVSELLSTAWGWRDYRHIAEHNVPVPLDRAMAARDTAYAAVLEQPGPGSAPELAVFGTLLAQYPERVLVAQTDRPYWFRVFRLKPGPVSPGR